MVVGAKDLSPSLFSDPQGSSVIGPLLKATAWFYTSSKAVCIFHGHGLSAQVDPPAHGQKPHPLDRIHPLPCSAQAVAPPVYRSHRARFARYWDMTWLQSVVLGVEIDPELFELISGQKGREELRAALLNTYFAHDIRQLLLREAVENQEAFEYSQRLLQVAEAAMPFGQPDRPQQVRDHGFRKAIMKLYSHRCALCGIRMITPEGHTIVEAAHIRPWADSQDDRPANGLALCRLCHWSFDRGFMSVNRDYEVLVSPLARSEENNPGHIMTLEQRPVFPPDDHRHIPDQECLGWHREEVFRV